MSARTVVVVYMSCGCLTWVREPDDVPTSCVQHDDEYVYVFATEMRVVQRP